MNWKSDDTVCHLNIWGKNLHYVITISKETYCKWNIFQFEHHFMWISLLLKSVCLSKYEIFFIIRECNVDKFVYTQNWILLKIQENWSTNTLMNHSILRIELKSKIFYKSNWHVNLNISWLSSIKEAVVFNWVISPVVSVSDVPGQGLEFPVRISVWSRRREKSPGKETAGKLEQ